MMPKKQNGSLLLMKTHLRCGDINIGMNDLAFDHADIIHDAIDKGL